MDEHENAPAGASGRERGADGAVPVDAGGRRRQRDRGDRWYRDRFQSSREDAQLASLLREWLSTGWPNDKIKPTFVEAEVEARLSSYRNWSRWWRIAQLSLWLLITLLGLLISIFAGLRFGHGFTIVGGALIATLTTLSNALHPSRQADGYMTARRALRDEVWAVLQRTGDYEAKNNQECYEHFAERVHTIVAAKRMSTNLGALGG